MKNVLVVVDMQNDFITGSLGSAAARAIVHGVKEKIAAFSGDVLFSADAHGSDYLQSLEGKALPVPHCIRGTEGFKLHPLLSDFAAKGNVFEKDTFGSRDLALYLQRENETNKIDRITIIGLCTDVCVISNALLLKAFLPQTRICVDAALCAGVTPQNHLTALKAMQNCQIEVERFPVAE